MLVASAAAVSAMTRHRHHHRHISICPGVELPNDFTYKGMILFYTYSDVDLGLTFNKKILKLVYQEH